MTEKGAQNVLTIRDASNTMCSAIASSTCNHWPCDARYFCVVLSQLKVTQKSRAGRSFCVLQQSRAACFIFPVFPKSVKGRGSSTAAPNSESMLLNRSTRVSSAEDSKRAPSCLAGEKKRDDSVKLKPPPEILSVVRKGFDRRHGQ